MKNNNLIPIAIVVAGILVAGAVYMNSRGGADGPTPDGNEPQEITLAPITAEDHILGNPDADIVIVEFSDLECPFCKSFHGTMNTIMGEYGKDGRVSWVYRHFPLTNLHSKAVVEAVATECAAELGGNQGFWDYINRLYEVTPSNNGLDLNLLPEMAEEVGLDKVKFEECLESERHLDKIEAQLNDGVAAGARGTPYNVLVLSDEISAETVELIESINAQYIASVPQGIMHVSKDNMKITVGGGIPLEMMAALLNSILEI
jgi:protein-disulfide isomerase